MDFELTQEEKAHRKEYFDFCKELEKKKPASFIGLETVFELDECWEFHLYCAKEFAKKGWLALAWPPEYGGSGTMMDKVLFAEARGYHGIHGVDIFGVQMLAPTLLQAASESIKKEFLPPIARGEVMWCELWSEPNAGSDLATLSTTAIKKGDEYIINGQKTWNTGAHRADWGFGVFKTDPTGRKHHNITFIMHDMKTPGITVRPIPYINGDAPFAEVYFDDVHVPAKNIVGQENEGWAIVNLLAGFERSGMGEIMGMYRELEELVEFCNTTKRNGKPLSKDPLVRNRVAELACELEAAKAIAYRIADLQNRNEMALMDASAAKIFYSELGKRFAFATTDIAGPFGQVKTSRWAPVHGLWERNFQECFVTIISMGTNEIQRNIISWYGLGLPRMK
ncbi:MAG: acyl-CoA dehydrogenase family protein [Dehalococcoidia bacterium]|nr:acyl-CoA dehydrogenase family protein [Dehalococcoidia bacterium]